MDLVVKRQKWHQDLFNEYLNYFKSTIKPLPNEMTKQFLRERFLFQHLSMCDRLIIMGRPLRYDFGMLRSTQYVAVLRVNFMDVECAYGLVYSSYDTEKDTFSHNVFCSGPTYASQDGEYRSRIISAEYYAELMTKYEDIFNQVESLVLDNLEADSFQVRVFCPNSSHQNTIEKKYITSIHSKRYSIILLCLSWLVDYYLIDRKLIPNHVDENYKKLMLWLGKHDKQNTFAKLVQQLGEENYATLIKHLTQEHFDLDHPVSAVAPQYGQKIIPLTMADTLNIENINADAWKEYFIASYCSNLVPNFISPSFPMVADWFIIHDSSTELFDNPAIYTKFEQSSIATGINTLLKDVDKKMHIEVDNLLQPLDKKFNKMSSYTKQAISYAQKDIVLTDYAMSFVMENMGPTVKNISQYTKDNTLYPGLSDVFSNDELFAKLLFEYVYAFCCMNAKLGVIHADLHMNNATIAQQFDLSNKPNMQPGMSKACFIVKDKSYLFENNGYFGSLIDFSRAFITNKSILEKEFGSHFAEIFLEAQQPKLVRFLEQLLPDFNKKYSGEIAKLSRRDPQLLCKIATLVDPYMFGLSMEVEVTFDPSMKDVGLSAKSKKLLQTVTQSAGEMLVSLLKDACDDNLSPDIDWPNLKLLDHFAEYQLDEKLMNKCIEFEKTLPKISPLPFVEDESKFGKVLVGNVFVFNRDLEYDLRGVDNWGPIISPEPIIRLGKKHGLPPFEWIEQWKNRVKRNDAEKNDAALQQKYATEIPDNFYETWMFL